SHGIAASANVNFAALGFRNLVVNGKTHLSASASNSGSGGQVVAGLTLNPGTVTNIHFGGFEMDVAALNAGGAGANAQALFVDPSPLVKLSIGSGGLRVAALVTSRDVAAAVASAPRH